jgi:hypothetical protein
MDINPAYLLILIVFLTSLLWHNLVRSAFGRRTGIGEQAF